MGCVRAAWALTNLAARQAEVEAVTSMVKSAEDSIALNNELIAVCAPANFDEWTKFKMEKTLQKARNDSATAVVKSLGAVAVRNHCSRYPLCLHIPAPPAVHGHTMHLTGAVRARRRLRMPPHVASLLQSSTR